MEGLADHTFNYINYIEWAVKSQIKQTKLQALSTGLIDNAEQNNQHSMCVYIYLATIKSIHFSYKNARKKHFSISVNVAIFVICETSVDNMEDKLSQSFFRYESYPSKTSF